MNRIKDTTLGILVFLIIAALVLVIYKWEKDKGHSYLAKRISVLSAKGGPPETIEGLKAAIAAYEEQIELNVKEGAQTGVYWKILAIRQADKGMHRDALDSFERALYYNAEDPTIFYLTGESATIVAASTLGFQGNSAAEKEKYSALAESAYLRAIQLDPTYAKPRLGLGVLYTFDMDRPDEAVVHLERYVQLMPNDLKGMFVLARAYYMTGNYEPALEMYDRIISKTKDEKVRTEAQGNKNIIWGLMDG
jgi:tetratricopeptide (TPR) repeat protein